MKKKILLSLLILSQISGFAFDNQSKDQNNDYSQDLDIEFTTYEEPGAPIDSWTPFLLIAGIMYSVYYFEKKRSTSALNK